METKPLIRHDRERIRRGQLKTFTELPFCAQEKFKLVAKEVKELDPTVEDVFVYGSYYWGFWDDKSDYDVRINTRTYPYSQEQFKTHVFEKHGFAADLMVMAEPKREMNLIKIPV